MKKILSLVVCLCVLLCTLSVGANEPPNEVSWSINNGVLTVSGSGAMDNYRNETDIPWYSRRNEITKIVVSEGITHIGNMAFYGLVNAKEADIADTVQTIGLCAFSYTEGSNISVDNLNLKYRFNIESDSSVVSNGDEFTISINLTCDFKDISTIQTSLIFDQERISIDENDWYDKEWYKLINDDNLGYIGKAQAGITANNLRLLYISTSGKKIDSGSPLYNKGETTITIAKVKCKALKDIEDINTSCFAIKNSKVLLAENSKLVTPDCAQTQLVNTTRLPIKDLVINKKGEQNPDNKNESTETSPAYDELTVMVNGKKVEYDVKPYINEDGIIMIPLRFTFEALGSSVAWENSTTTAFIIYKDNFAAAQVGRAIFFENTSSRNLKSPITVLNGRTMVSYDCIENAFDLSTNYNKEANLITISQK